MRHQGQEGQGIIEYAMLIVFIALVVIAILTLMGPVINTMFQTLTSGL